MHTGGREMEGISIGIIIAAIIAVLIIILLAAGYVKAPPNKAYIISGMRKRPKILIGLSLIHIFIVLQQ